MKIRNTLFVFLMGMPAMLIAQCPRLAGIMVDACSSGATENRNEFVFFLNGSAAVNVDDLRITFPANAAIGAGTTDFAPNTGSAPVGACLATLDDGGVIPPNAPFIIFMSSNVAVSYDFTSWCAQFGTVYLLYKTNPAPTTATFLNEDPGGLQRSVTLDVNGSSGCAATYTYNVTVGTGISQDGNFFRFPLPIAGISLSPGFVNNGCASPPFELLPVTLQQFSASYRNGSAILSWATSQELNASHFEVLKSTDGANFSVSGTVKATGNSDITRQYSFTDPAVSGRVYYRLRTVDIDGSAALSRIITLRAQSGNITLNALYPNPAAGQLTIEWNGIHRTKTTVSIRNLAGKLLQTENLYTNPGFNQLVLNTGPLPAGQYIIRLDFGSEQITQTFLKQ